ncbi:MAG TPA: dihydrofolate reductase family protein, partial [Balneolaceae bacterium]|nr:dihydrofolate reductase family protein [Balneolaceae bacterium]
MQLDNTNHILRLFPSPNESRPLHGLYLSEPLRPAGTPTQPFVYATFIASLDGRISLPDSKINIRKPPPSITNPRDWRLFQELAASADVVVTSGRYIRDLSAGEAQDSLPVSDKPEFADLLQWRQEHNLSPQPAVVIVTKSIDLKIPDELLQSERSIYVATGTANNKSHIKRLHSQGVRLIEAGKTFVEGDKLIAALAEEGFGNIFMTAGGVLLNTLIKGNVFHRLYLNQACRLLGGVRFDTLLKGAPLEPPAD